MKILNIIYLLAFTSLLSNSSYAQSISNNPWSIDSNQDIAYCTSSSSDTSEDGWGWENSKSCIIKDGKADTSEIIHPVCNSNLSDSDGDGWGWENQATCIVTQEPSQTENPSEALHDDPVIDSATPSTQNDNEIYLTEEPTNNSSTQDVTINFLFSDFAQAQIEYGKTKVDTMFGAKESSFNYKSHQQTLQNLSPGTNYFYRVHFSGQGSNNKDLITNWFSFSTLETSSNPTVANNHQGVVKDHIEERDTNQRANLGTAKMGDWGSPRPPSGSPRWLKVPVKPSDFYGIGLKNPVLSNATEGWVSYNIRLKNWNKSKYSMKLPGVSAALTGSGGSSPVSKWIGGQGGGGAGGTTGGPDGKGKSWSARMFIAGMNISASDSQRGKLFYELYHKDSTNKPSNQPAKQYGEPEQWDADIRDEKWHNIKHYVKLNDIGKANGTLRGYFDGKLAYERKNISFADNPKYRDIAVMLNVYHGGSIPATDYFEVYMDEIYWAEGPEK